uniref:Uncharacterized protein n=1 Tax=viral metagenome TaxID=1070528 RepID=A0A6C0C9G7_9ZZZZ
MAEVDQKTVDQLTQMYEKLSEAGILEQFIETARLNESKKMEEKKVDEKKVDEKKVDEKITSIRKIEHWYSDQDKTVKTPRLISAEDFKHFYEALDKDTIVFEVLEMCDTKSDSTTYKLNEKTVIAPAKFFSSLKDQTKIDTSSDTGIRRIKVEKGVESLFGGSTKNVIVNYNNCQMIKKMSGDFKSLGDICLVKNSDFESFPMIDMITGLEKDIKEKFCVFDYWLNCNSFEKVLVVASDVPKMKICDADKIYDKDTEFVLAHAITIDENFIGVEKHTIVSNKNLGQANGTFQKVKRIYSSSATDANTILVGNASFSRLHQEWSLAGKKMSHVITLYNSVYGGAHFSCIVDKEIFDKLNVMCPKNNKLNENEFNLITHYSPTGIQKMLITKSQLDEINKGSSGIYQNACVITFFNITDNNITEEIAVTHVSWRAQSVSMFKLDDESKLIQGYIQPKHYAKIKEEKFTFESKPTSISTVFFQGKFVECLVTEEQLARVD